jgi:nifR3 family TIM-barrel protein
MKQSSVFYIGDVPVSGELVLAPMSGFNDQPFRRLCQANGAALTYTGLLAANSIMYGKYKYGNRRTDEMLRLHPDEHPLVCQLFGSDVDILEGAANKILPLNMDVIDVNMGCAKYKIIRGGAGAALLREPSKIGRIIRRLSQTLPLPVTGKIRLGWDEEDKVNRRYMEYAHVLEDNGASMVAVHGRTAKQGYAGEADWDAIAEIKQKLTVPVLASGDVKSVRDIQRIKAHTGCDAVMIGRAAIGNPWLFQYLDRDDVPWIDRLPVVLQHLESMLVFHGSYHGLRRFRKHLRGYLRRSGLPRWYRSQMLVCDDVDALVKLLQASMDRLIPQMN